MLDYLWSRSRGGEEPEGWKQRQKKRVKTIKKERGCFQKRDEGRKRMQKTERE